MPKEVDHDERRDEILTAVAGLLADVGLRGLSVRSLAARLGGSVTMVTHYFPTRHSLLVSIGPWILKKWQAEIEELANGDADPITKLHEVLAWLIPITPEGFVEERAGLSLLVGDKKDAVAVQGLRTELDAWLRGLVRDHLAGLVDKAYIEPAVDLLYAVTRGISVSTCEDPLAWPAARQLAVLDDVLASLGLLPGGDGVRSRLKGTRGNMRVGECDQEEGT